MEIRYQTAHMKFSLRAAALIIQNGQLLVAKNDSADCYYTIGGGVQLGETTEEAAVRECLEETGHEFVVDRLVFVQERFFSAGDTQHHEVVFFYLMQLVPLPIGNGQHTDQPDERLYWLPLNQLHEVPLVPVFLREGVPKLPQSVQHVVSYE